jgi:outer membrane lipoprotein-sorting protein
MFKLFSVLVLLLSHSPAFSQEVKVLLQKVKSKYDLVYDYTANGKLKTNVLFIKAPIANVKVYYKKPDKIKIQNEKGVSFIPKGSVNINMNNVLGLKDFEAVAGGIETVAGVTCKIVKIFPLNDNDNISRATLYIDEKQMLVIKSVISTKENGTYEIVMTYKKYATFGLPDKAIVTFNTKDYKLPKGITIDYDNGTTDASKDAKAKTKKGTVEIIYTDYSINKGVADAVFKN